MDLLIALFAVFLAFWLLGVSFLSSLGAIIHLLLVIAIIIIAIRLLRGQSV